MADEIRDNLNLQLSEMEMLESMFPSEIEYDDEFILSDIKKYIEQNSELLFDSFSFRIKLSIDDGKKYTISVSMSNNYPSKSALNFHIRSDNFSRDNQSKINADLADFLSSEFKESGELMTGSMISWLQENVVNYFEKEEKSAKCESIENNDKLIRMWIYSHHIYSKIKRKDILDLSRDYQVRGFSMPGKPGIICLEGIERNCQEMWSVIKSWNWKKINVKLTEFEESKEEFGKFDNFEEIGFIKSDQIRDYHMDMGAFQKYLSNHKCDYIFKELFGFEK